MHVRSSALLRIACLVSLISLGLVAITSGRSAPLPNILSCGSPSPAILLSNGIDQVLVFGTIHIRHPRIEAVTRKTLEQPIAQATTIFTETGVPPGQIPTSFARLLNELPSADKMLEGSSELRRRWSDLSGGRLDKIDLFTLLVQQGNAASTIMRDLDPQPNPASFLDSEGVIFDLTKINHKKIVPIERGDSIKVIQEFPPADLIAYSAATIQIMEDLVHRKPNKLVDANSISLETFLNWWQTGDFEAIERSAYESEIRTTDNIAKPLFHISIVRRNHRMVTRLLNTIEQYPRGDLTIVAVGAAHLGGEEGIISLLKKQGFTDVCDTERRAGS
jgi:uncharacterized protein YbaP (TraB family)